MNPDKPDISGLYPPKQFRRLQDLAERITGSTAVERVRAQAAAIEKFNLANQPLIARVKAQMEAMQKIHEGFFGSSIGQRIQPEILKAFQFPEHLADITRVAERNIYSTQLQGLQGITDQIDLAFQATSSIESLRAALSSLPDTGINRLANEFALLSGRFEEQGEIAAGYEEVHESLDRLKEAPTLSEFSNIFASLPGAIKLALVLIFIGFWDVFSSVAGNLITPHVKELIEDPALTQREKVAKVRAGPLRLDPLLKSQVRFINAERVNLRICPSIKSTIVTVMSTGRVVTVLSKRRNWIEVTFVDDNGDEFEGWVFTRYTSRFR